MWRSTLVFLGLLMAFPAFGGKTVKRGPGNISAGSDAGMYEFCRRGGKGVGIDASTDPPTYAATCGNYAWSAEYGGYTGTLSDYNTPTCSGGCGEYVNCTGSGTGTLDDGTVVIEEACYHNGERVKVNVMADIQLALDFVRPSSGCNVYLPTFAGYVHGLYSDRGCGDKHDGTDNHCPVLRAPQDTHLQRKIQIVGGRTLCLEGMDPDGPYEPLTSDADERRQGVYIIKDTGGWEGGTSGTSNVDPNGDAGTDVSFGTVVFGCAIGHGSQNSCVPRSTTDHDCNPVANIVPNLISCNKWGADTTIIAPTGVGVDSYPRLCIEGRPDTHAVDTASGTCRGDRRVACTTDNDYCTALNTPWACCSGAGAGTCDARATTTTGGCDFGAGGDIGPCEGYYDALEYEIKERNNDNLIVAATVSIAPFDETGTAAGDMTTMGTISKFSGTGGTCVAGTNDGQISFGSFGGMSDGGIWDRDVTESWILPNQEWLPTTTWNNVLVVDRAVYANFGGGMLGGSGMLAVYNGRVADDVVISGTADSGSLTTLVVSPDPGWGVNDYRYMTLIARSDDEWKWEEDAAGTHKEARMILSNTSDTLTITGGAYDFTDAVANGDVFRVSKASCVYADSYAIAGEDACDTGAFYRARGTGGGELAYHNSWYNGCLDHGSGPDVFSVHDIKFARHQGLVSCDISRIHLYNFEIVDNFSEQSLIKTNFGSYSFIENGLIQGNIAAQIITIGNGQGGRFNNITWINNIGPYCIMMRRTGLMTWENFTGFGNTCVFMISPSDEHTVANLQIRNWNFYGMAPRYNTTGIPNSLIAFGDNNEANEGDILNINIDGVFWHADKNPSGTNYEKLALVALEDPAGAALFADNYDELSIRNSGIYTKNATDSKIVCGWDAGSWAYNLDCDDEPGSVLNYTYPPVMTNNTQQGKPAPEQPWSWALAADYAGYDCDTDYTSASGFEVAIVDDDGACSSTAGVLDGGGAVPTICVCSGGVWAAR